MGLCIRNPDENCSEIAPELIVSVKAISLASVMANGYDGKLGILSHASMQEASCCKF